MLRKLFQKQKPPTVWTHISDVKTRLDIYQKAKPDADIHKQVLIALKRYTSPGLYDVGRGYTYYTHPDRTVSPDTKTPNGSESRFKSSANFSFAEEILDGGQRSFAMTINQDSESYADMRNRMVFGLYGTYDESGDMEVETIFAPDMDDDGNFTGMISIPLSERDLELALIYAHHCINAIHEDQSPNAVQCLNRAIIERDFNELKDDPPSP